MAIKLHNWKKTMSFLKHVIWSQGYRPLFLMATLASIASILGWQLTVSGVWLPGYLEATQSSPTLWHAHEMLFGFAGAAIGGFLLTAVPNWTGIKPIAPAPLAIIVLLWLIGRSGMWLSLPDTLHYLFALADIGYFLGLCLWVSYAISVSRNKRNIPFIVLSLLLTLLNTAYYFGSDIATALPAFGIYGAFACILIIVNIIGGRIIPLFTTNWVRGNVPIAGHYRRQNPTVDKLSHISLVTFLLCYILKAPESIVLVIGILTSSILFYRWWLWRFWDTTAEPLLWILHLGYVWLPIGILLLSVASTFNFSTSAGLHSLTAGVIGTMILAVASRVALGHSGRQLTSRPSLTTAYILVTLAVITRILFSLAAGGIGLLHLSTLLWCTGFTIFLITYWPILTKPRVC